MPAVNTLDRTLDALADATRRDILRRAIQHDESVSDLAEHYPMSFAAVQKHVAILERAGLITKRAVGHRRIVQIAPAGLAAVQALLDELEEAWRGRVSRMSDLLDQDPQEGTS